MRKTSPKDALYPPGWIESGFLDREFVDAQISDLERDEHPDREGYRWAGYLEVVESERFDTEERRYQFLKLIDEDPNEHLWKGAITELIEQGKFDESWLRLLPSGRVATWPLIKEKIRSKDVQKS